ncbi:MAG TPA: hypothetical protein VJH75_02755 [Patescibacteria group bacterium]|nr:hypothetical protein [Patescibacteria group bacterium]
MPEVRGKELDRYRYAGVWKERSREVLERLEGVLEEMGRRSAEDLVREDQEKYRPAIEYMVGLYLAWARERLGLDLGRRKPHSESVVIREVSGYEEINQRGYTDVITRDIYAAALQSKDATFLSILGHELGHLFAATSLHPDQEKFVRGGRTGYENLSTGNYQEFNDWINEMINQEVLQMGRQRDGLRIEVEDHFRPEGLIILDTLWVDLSRRRKKRYDQISDVFYRGYFTGDTRGLRMIKDTYGVEALKALSQIKDKELVDQALGVDMEDLERFLTSVGLSLGEIVRKASVMEEGKYQLGNGVRLWHKKLGQE